MPTSTNDPHAQPDLPNTPTTPPTQTPGARCLAAIAAALDATPYAALMVRDPGTGWHTSNRHRAVIAEHRRVSAAWRTNALAAGMAYRRSHPGYEPPPRYVIAYYTHRTSNARADADNLQPTTKAIRDGLVQAGLLADDYDGMVAATVYLPGRRHTRAERVAITVHIHTLGDS